LIADATIDAYDTSEQLMGFFNMIGEHLAVPFKTTILGLAVTVEGVMCDESRFVAECVRGEYRQTIDLRDLPIPSPPLPDRSGSPHTAAGQDGSERVPALRVPRDRPAADLTAAARFPRPQACRRETAGRARNLLRVIPWGR
jgi:hypothetical protein